MVDISTSLDFTTLRSVYASGSATPEDVFAEVLARIRARGDDGVWVYKVPQEDVLARARDLSEIPTEQARTLPLFGIPFSVKDCIDVAGHPTSAACPDFAYMPEHTNLSVQKALDAGAILLGKTNMDQFATGVVGTRTPYGVARNPFNADYIPGGSSSGAAVSVSAGICSFAFGSDTGGSGRVPASYNNIVGLKPTLGLFSRADMVNASRHFDTISVYALNPEDAGHILETCRGVDARDAWGREWSPETDDASLGKLVTIAVPKREDREFFGNNETAALYADAIECLAAAGHEIVEIDFDVFFETSNMMFDGPLLAERYASVGKFVESHPMSVDPSVREVILSAKRFSAADLCNSLYKLKENVRVIKSTFDAADIIAVPTVGTVYRVDEVAADPLRTNANNGQYMNFVSMADLAAIAVPNGFLSNGVPFGITLIGRAFSDFALTRFASDFLISNLDNPKA